MLCNLIFKLLLLLTLFATGLAAPATESSGNSTTHETSACDPNKYGCSACSECCILTYASSASQGCAGLNDPQQPIWSVSKPDIGCQNLVIGVYAAKVQECTGWFDSCVLWSERDCKGVQTSVQNVRGSCAAPFVIRSVGCIGGWGGDV